MSEQMKSLLERVREERISALALGDVAIRPKEQPSDPNNDSTQQAAETERPPLSDINIDTVQSIMSARK